jgi:hypothetical protein
MEQGMGLDILKHKFYGEKIAAPMLKTINEIVRSDPFNLEHSLEHYWENASEERLKDTLITHGSVFALCKAVQAGIEYLVGEKGIEFNEKYCAGLSLGRYLVLPFNEQNAHIISKRGLELMDTPQGSKELVGWKKSLLETKPDFEFDSSGYTLARIIGLEEESIEKVAQETNVQISNYNAPTVFNISGSRMAVARAVDLAKSMRARAQILGLPPFHNEILMAGFENSFGRIADAEKNRYSNKLNATLISDLNSCRIETFKEFFDEAGKHGRYRNNWANTAAALEELDVALVVVGFSEKSATAMQSLLGPKKKKQAILAYGPESIEAAANQLITIYKANS